MSGQAEFFNYLASIEFQAAFTICDKYKRSLSLDMEDLRKLELAATNFSEERKAVGKTPNLDFLTQKVGEFLKTYKTHE